MTKPHPKKKHKMNWPHTKYFTKTTVWLCLGVLALLGACQDRVSPPTKTFEPVSIYSAGSIGPISGGIGTLAFAPNATAPWQGRLLIALKTGGLALYSIEGQAENTFAGPMYRTLAVHPDFSLRDLKTSLVFALDTDGHLHPLIIDDEMGQILDAPISGLPGDIIAGICTLPGAGGSPRFGLIREHALEEWEITDQGRATLQAIKIRTHPLPVLGNRCMAAGEHVFVAAKNGTIFPIGGNMQSKAKARQKTKNRNWIALEDEHKQIYVLASHDRAQNLTQYDQNFAQIGALRAVESLSLPPVAMPGALALSTYSFGGSGFSAGLLAIADTENQNIALVVLDTLPGFSHHQFTQ